MARSLKFLTVVALAIAPIAAGIATPAGATTHTAARFSGVMQVRPAALPNTDLSGKGAKLAFKPAKLSASWSGPKSKPACKPAKAAFTISNPTAKTVVIDYKGSQFASIPSGFLLDVCGWGSGTAKLVLTLEGGSAKKLTVTFS